MSKAFSYTTSMFGTFNFDDLAEGTQATQKQRKTRRKAEPTVEKRPTAVSESGNASAGSAKVEAVFNTIKDVSIDCFESSCFNDLIGNCAFQVYRKNGGKPIPYFQLVIDPTNMMYTFDNTFQVSFLFRDGCIAFVKDDEGLPAIKPIVGPKPPKPSEMTSFTSSLNHNLIQVI